MGVNGVASTRPRDRVLLGSGVLRLRLLLPLGRLMLAIGVRVWSCAKDDRVGVITPFALSFVESDIVVTVSADMVMVLVQRILFCCDVNEESIFDNRSALVVASRLNGLTHHAGSAVGKRDFDHKVCMIGNQGIRVYHIAWSHTVS